MEEGKVHIRLGSGAQVLYADDAKGLANPSRTHLACFHLRTGAMPPRLATQTLGRWLVTARLWDCLPCRAGCWCSMGTMNTPSFNLEKMSL